jgi:DHA3 family macrolide efflux protein-like MFS transporter
VCPDRIHWKRTFFVLWLGQAFSILGSAAAQFAFPAYVQAAVRPEALGRVLTPITSPMSLAIPVGLVAAGPVAKVVGVASWFTISGVAILLATALGHLLTRRFAPTAPVAEGPTDANPGP